MPGFSCIDSVVHWYIGRGRDALYKKKEGKKEIRLAFLKGKHAYQHITAQTF